MNEEVMIPKSYHDKVCEEIIRFKDKQFYDAVHLLDDGTLEIHVTDYKMVKRVLVEDDNNFGNFFCEDKADRPQGEWIPCSERLPSEKDYIGDVVIWCTDKSIVGVGWYYESTKSWATIDDTFPSILGKVIAWMPLPNPWKGADDE